MRDGIAAAGLVLIGLAALAAAYVVLDERPQFAERPEAAGDVGALIVFAQTPDGPVPLQPGRLRALPRPQDFAFRFAGRGTGPRWIRLEVEADGETDVVYEKQHEMTGDTEALGFVLRFSEEMPDLVTLVTYVEAPHAMTVSSRFPFRLSGAETRFWEPAQESQPDLR